MSAATERSKIVDYLYTQLVTGITPDGRRFELSEAEEHSNAVIRQLAVEIQEGRHYR